MDKYCNSITTSCCADLDLACVCNRFERQRKSLQILFIFFRHRWLHNAWECGNVFICDYVRLITVNDDNETK